MNCAFVMLFTLHQAVLKVTIQQRSALHFSYSTECFDCGRAPQGRTQKLGEVLHLNTEMSKLFYVF